MGVEQHIRENWHSLQNEIDEFCSLNGVTKPKIIAVSKTRSVDEIQAALDCGIKEFGENYVNELVVKSKSLSHVNWHFIGHLQRRNTANLVPIVDYIHSVDSLKLVNRLGKLEYTGKVMIQVNLSLEKTKSGILPDKSIINMLLEGLHENKLKVIGLMAIGHPNWKQVERIQHFSKVAELNRFFNFTELSLGMSADWKEAILAGSTMIRIGTRIFGQRS
ncbi:MAG: YggS family pyridoxal phosphate-dependent enzyme [Candidatus Heimdallarchaeota archaeon]|nr:YggS family pyridoxal phosphate-dependent enzyme [Candidatus Heimdallarchaeota archaeon]